MRAVAVLAVFADHLFGWPTGGFVGVDVFFVLSGFFITGLLLRERSTDGTVSFTNFYVRRARRILPSALLVLVVTVVSAYFLLPARARRKVWSMHCGRPCSLRTSDSSRWGLTTSSKICHRRPFSIIGRYLLRSSSTSYGLGCWLVFSS
ncbi:acyltransferase family protein [Mycolicibacterium gilvum]